MPQVGERRSGATETVEWNGSRWAPVDGSGSTQVPATFARVNGQNVPPSTVDNPRSFGLLDYVPGLRDVMNLPENIYKGAKALPDVGRGLLHEPAATLKGFASGASEATTPGRAGLLALLSGGATLPAALGAAGLESAGEAGRIATGAPNAATSFPQAAGRVAEAASVPAVAAAFGAIPKIPGVVGSAVRKLGPTGQGAVLGGVEGYRRDGLTGAVEGTALGAAGGHFGSRLLTGRLGRVLGALQDEGAGATAENGSALDQVQPLAAKVRGEASREAPGFSYKPAAAPASPGIDPLPQSTISTVDRYMPNSGAPAVANPARASSGIPYGSYDPEATVSAIVDRYMPNSGGAEPVATPRPATYKTPYGVTEPAAADAVPVADPNAPHMDLSTPLRAGSLTQEQIGQRYAAAKAAGGSSATANYQPSYVEPPVPGSVPQSKLDTAISGIQGEGHAAAEAENIANGSSFSNGHILPEGRPTELLDSAEEGGSASPQKPYDIDYGGIVPDFSFEAGNADRPGLSLGSAGPKTTLDRLEGASAAPVPRPAATPMQPFSKFSDAIDSIVDQAEPGDFPPARTGFLSRSTPTKADRAGLAQLRLADTLRALQPQ